MKQLIEEQKNKAEIAIFWEEIASHLPKSVERSALGDEKICRAFAIAYPKIKQALLKQFIDGLIEVQNEHVQKELSVERFARPDFYKGYEASKNETIAHLKELKEELN